MQQFSEGFPLWTKNTYAEYFPQNLGKSQTILIHNVHLGTHPNGKHRCMSDIPLFVYDTLHVGTCIRF